MRYIFLVYLFGARNINILVFTFWPTFKYLNKQYIWNYIFVTEVIEAVALASHSETCNNFESDCRQAMRLPRGHNTDRRALAAGWVDQRTLAGDSFDTNRQKAPGVKTTNFKCQIEGLNINWS
jgi:hypothetical protein